MGTILAIAFFVVLFLINWEVILLAAVLAGCWLLDPTFREACHSNWYSKWRQG